MLVIVGGHSRNIGKTAVMTGLIRSLPWARWTAVKITQYGHGVCSHQGESCECASHDPAHPYTITQEFEPDPRTDSGRFLAAGARESYWLRTQTGQFDLAVPALRRILAASENAILESNTALERFLPDLYIVVLDFAVRDFKDSSRRFLERADALAVIDRGGAVPPWPGIPRAMLEAKPRFLVKPPDYVNPGLVELVRARWGPLAANSPPGTRS